MKYIAKFEKVSKAQFVEGIKKVMKDYSNLFAKSDEGVDDVYDNIIKLPKRSTAGSAGYDFVSPFGFSLKKGESIVIPTGIRCRIDDSWVLNLYPRSGLGFKTHVRLANTVGIIDSDYYYSDNEGHIMIKLVAEKPIEVNAGDRFAQGVFTEYGITVDDEATETRNGGFGSSGK